MPDDKPVTLRSRWIAWMLPALWLAIAVVGRADLSSTSVRFLGSMGALLLLASALHRRWPRLDLRLGIMLVVIATYAVTRGVTIDVELGGEQGFHVYAAQVVLGVGFALVFFLLPAADSSDLGGVARAAVRSVLAGGALLGLVAVCVWLLLRSHYELGAYEVVSPMLRSLIELTVLLACTARVTPAFGLPANVSRRLGLGAVATAAAAWVLRSY